MSSLLVSVRSPIELIGCMLMDSPLTLRSSEPIGPHTSCRKLSQNFRPECYLVSLLAHTPHDQTPSLPLNLRHIPTYYDPSHGLLMFPTPSYAHAVIYSSSHRLPLYESRNGTMVFTSRECFSACFRSASQGASDVRPTQRLTLNMAQDTGGAAPTWYQ